ncbi:hypothetical protein [Crocosphaera sp.]|uniref:hypothetical protein n=1 Tax=Crocosphaera sp. TaxID=2729996 RepID=UPI00260541A8|nr:hypothetical protein [Crocosphaera sp.]MDJ0582918.1 hypothetical protein [Crocosphaera sp.]
MSAIIIRTKQQKASQNDTNSNTGDFYISGVSIRQSYLLKGIGVDVDLFGDFEDRIWGEVDGVYNVGDPPPS